jgi:ArsR family transcriptional regulator, arsenate/arsenite/antimonite-responsive transcriptional repressor
VSYSDELLRTGASAAVDIVTGMSDLLGCCTPLAGSSLSNEDATELERLFKLIADRSRLRILNMLVQADGEPVCVCEFTEMLNVSQPTVSHHLKQLTEAGLLERERRGSFVYFSLRPGTLDRVASLIAQPASAR